MKIGKDIEEFLLDSKKYFEKTITTLHLKNDCEVIDSTQRMLVLCESLLDRYVHRDYVDSMTKDFESCVNSTKLVKYKSDNITAENCQVEDTVSIIVYNKAKRCEAFSTSAPNKEIVPHHFCCPFDNLPAGHLPIKKSPKYGPLYQVDDNLRLPGYDKYYCGVLDEWFLIYERPTSSFPKKIYSLKTPGCKIVPIGRSRKRDTFTLIVNHEERISFCADSLNDTIEWFECLKIIINTNDYVYENPKKLMNDNITFPTLPMKVKSLFYGPANEYDIPFIHPFKVAGKSGNGHASIEKKISVELLNKFDNANISNKTNDERKFNDIHLILSNQLNVGPVVPKIQKKTIYQEKLQQSSNLAIKSPKKWILERLYKHKSSEKDDDELMGSVKHSTHVAPNHLRLLDLNNTADSEKRRFDMIISQLESQSHFYKIFHH